MEYDILQILYKMDMISRYYTQSDMLYYAHVQFVGIKNGMENTLYFNDQYF